jgi:hypothetical protein
MQFEIKVYLDLVEIMIYAKGKEQATINVTFVHHEPQTSTILNLYQMLQNGTLKFTTTQQL